MRQMLHDVVLLSRLPKVRWKVHEKLCATLAAAKEGHAPAGSTPNGSSASNAGGGAAAHLSPPKGLDRPVDRPFTRLMNGTWLHDRSQTDVYRLLIDAYRLRVEDNYKFDGDVDADSLYAGASSGLAGFRRFLDLVASRGGLLPAWWDSEKRAECERLGMTGSEWQDL